jgi:UPF0716 protein FxsA
MRRRGLALLPVGLSLLAIAEIVVFIVVAHAIGGGWAILLAAAASLAGMVLLRREGIKGWRRFQAASVEGRPPGSQVINSLVGLLGALLLAVPGFITAVAGVLLLLPPGRPLARRGVERFTERRVGYDLFGPRKVRVRPGEPIVVIDEQPVRTPAGAIEGEIVP